MIRYDLICAAGHNFEGWFSSSADFDKQRGAGQIPCAICASPNIDRAIMAPNVSTSRQKEKAAAELREEGVTALPLPDILSPHHKTKSN